MPLDLPKIKKLMYQKKITQEKLASLLKISPSAVYRKLSGDKPFLDNQVGQLSDIFKVKVDDLYYTVNENAKKEGIF